MSKLKIGYKNILESLASHSFTVGSEDLDNPFVNCYDNLLFDFMRLAASATPYEIEVNFTVAQDVDYLAFYKSNLADVGGSIKLQYWTGAAWADASTTISPTDTTPIMQIFTSQNSDKFKLIIDNNNTDVTIADIKFGEHITTEYGIYIGFEPPILARNIDYDNNTSDRGLPLGRSIRNKGFGSTLNLEFMGDVFARSTWLPFIKHAECYPFYLAWNITDYPAEIAYTVTDGPIDKPKQTHTGLMAVNVKVTGFTE